MKRPKVSERGVETPVSTVKVQARELITMKGVLWDQPGEWGNLEGAIVRVDPPVGVDPGAVEGLRHGLLNDYGVAAVKVLPVPAEAASREAATEVVPEGETAREAAMALVDALPGDFREDVRAAVGAALSAACL